MHSRASYQLDNYHHWRPWRLSDRNAMQSCATNSTCLDLTVPSDYPLSALCAIPSRHTSCCAAVPIAGAFCGLGHFASRSVDGLGGRGTGFGGGLSLCSGGEAVRLSSRVRVEGDWQ
jgi:hypothetical protein